MSPILRPLGNDISIILLFIFILPAAPYFLMLSIFGKIQVVQYFEFTAHTHTKSLIIQHTYVRKHGPRLVCIMEK